MELLKKTNQGEAQAFQIPVWLKNVHDRTWVWRFVLNTQSETKVIDLIYSLSKRTGIVTLSQRRPSPWVQTASKYMGAHLSHPFSLRQTVNGPSYK